MWPLFEMRSTSTKKMCLKTLIAAVCLLATAVFGQAQTQNREP